MRQHISGERLQHVGFEGADRRGLRMRYDIPGQPRLARIVCACGGCSLCNVRMTPESHFNLGELDSVAVYLNLIVLAAQMYDASVRSLEPKVASEIEAF